MIHYKVLRVLDKNSNNIVYLYTDDFKDKRARKVFSSLNLNIFQDFELVINVIDHSFFLNRCLFENLSYSEVEDLFSYIQCYINNFSKEKNISNYVSDLLKELERILLYWDDYN